MSGMGVNIKRITEDLLPFPHVHPQSECEFC